MLTTVRAPAIKQPEGKAYLDTVVIEAPLEMRIIDTTTNLEHRLAVTLRTPGNDAALLLGYLHSEGIITNVDNVVIDQPQDQIIRARLPHDAVFKAGLVQRRGYMHGGCGVCGKTMLEGIMLQPRQEMHAKVQYDQHWQHVIEKAIHQQLLFSKTGGTHAVALFDTNKQLLTLQEDVGRHNAFDKAVGEQLLTHASATVAWVSARAGFELVQKSVMAGISMLVAVGATTSFALELAEEYNMTIVAFARDTAANIYG